MAHQESTVLEELFCRIENGAKPTKEEKLFMEERLSLIPSERSALPKGDEIGRIILDDQEKTIREYLRIC